MSTCGVLLAAGGGSRFRGDTHKLLALLDGRPLVERALDAVTGAGLDRVVVVTGAVDLTDLLGGRGVSVVANPDWEHGIASSLQAGLRVARDAGDDAVVVGLADQPGVTAEAWRAIAAADATPIAVATYDGRRGNPVRLAASVWSRLPEDGDEGARAVMRAHPELVTEVPCSGTALDIDTVDQLERWQPSTAEPGGTP